MKIWPCILLMITCHTYGMENQSVENECARILLATDKDTWPLLVWMKLHRIDPNGATSLGTPLVQFVSGPEALKLLYKLEENELAENTLSRAIQDYLSEKTLFTNDNRAAILIANQDPHIDQIDKKTAIRLLRKFESIERVYFTDTPTPQDRMASIYRKATLEIYDHIQTFK